MTSTEQSSASGNATEDIELPEIDPKDFSCTFKTEDRIGRGSFAAVYRGQWRGSTVAAKKFLDTANYSTAEIMALLYEGKVVKELKHENVIGIFGFYRPIGQDVCLVMEYAEGRSLEDVVKTHNMHSNSEMKSNKVHYQWAIQLANGLEYIQSKTYAHRDLKSNNVLIKEPITSETDVHNKTLKLADFGYAKSNFTKTKESTRISGAEKYQAPETKQNIYSPKSDVWSYGIIVHEILYGETPDLRNGVPVFRTGFPAFFKDLLAGCWIVEPREHRYAIGHVLELLRIAAALPDSPRCTSRGYATSEFREPSQDYEPSKELRQTKATGSQIKRRDALNKDDATSRQSREWDCLDNEQLRENFRRNYSDLVNSLSRDEANEAAKQLFSRGMLLLAELERVHLDKNTATEAAEALIIYVTTKRTKEIYCAFLEILQSQLNRYDLVQLLTSVEP